MFSTTSNRRGSRGNYTHKNSSGFRGNNTHRSQQNQQQWPRHEAGPNWGFPNPYDYPPNPRNSQLMGGEFPGNYQPRDRDRPMLYPEPDLNYNPQRPRVYPDRSPQYLDRSDNREKIPRRNRERSYANKNVPTSSSQGVDTSNKQEVDTLSKQGVTSKNYTCPGCNSSYYFSGGRISGKVPLILNCKHTVCQECIHTAARKNNILCPVCQKPSALPDKNLIDNLSAVFLPNYHIIGVIAFSRCANNANLSLTLVPTDDFSHKKDSSRSKVASVPIAENEERCCFASCDKLAFLRCDDCSDVYCKDCSVVVHKSAKSMRTHKPQPIAKKSPCRELDLCHEHNMHEEYMCKQCHVGACCYCVIEKHTGHSKDDITKLSDEELCQVLDNTGKVKRIYKQLLASQRKLRDLSNPEATAAEKKLSNYFAHLYGRLEVLEKNLLKKTSDFEVSLISPEDQQHLATSIGQSMAYLRSLIQDCEHVGDKKLNLKKLKTDLDDALQTPCYLMADDSDGLDPIHFEVDPVVERLEDCFKVSAKGVSGLKLVRSDELPPDYEIKELDSQVESDFERSVNSVDLSDGNRRRSNPKRQCLSKIKKTSSLDNELVEVTHIESLECFYVQMKKMQGQLRQLQDDINNFINMADIVEHPELNELYLALYTNQREKIWCRGRLIEMKNGETEPLYEIFFIDYGSSQTVDVTKLREITSTLAQTKPFAIQCQLYYPGNSSWKKNAHVYMGKMINGKDIYIMLKDKSNSVNIVDLLVSSSDRSLTSLVEILIHTCGSGRNGDTSSESSQQGFSSEHKIFANSKSFEKSQLEHVMIAKVVDPDNIYIHLAANLEALKKLQAALKIHYRNAKSNSCLLIESSYVVVEHRDSVRGNWHRAMIKKVDISHETANVFLVDWGFHVTVPWNRVKMMKEQLIAMEAQVIRVKLAQIEPLNKTGGWPDQVVHFLQKYYHSRETLKMLVHEKDPLEVVLLQTNGSIDVCINALLVKEKLANSLGPLSTKLEWETDRAEVVPFSKEEGLVESLLAKVELSDSAESADEDPTVVRQQIRIVKMISPALIYIRFVIKDDVAAALHKELQIHYSVERELCEAWKTGEDCVVIHGNFYTRGKVLGAEGEDYRVNLYDQAEEVTLPKSKIFVYSKYFYKYANIVYKAYLANIKPAGGDTWSMSAVETLEKIFEKYSEIYATKVPGDTSDKSIPMKMWYTHLKVGSALEANELKFYCINNKLVKMGFAYRITPRATAAPEPSEAALKPSEKLLLSLVDNTDAESNNHTVDGGEQKPEVTDWNALVEEEENEATETKILQNEPITDWLPPFRPKEKEFYAWITCAETEGIVFYREEYMQEVYKEMETQIKNHFDNRKLKGNKKRDWKEGDLCTIIYQDRYYRGKIFKVTDQDHITAVMIDFGSDHDLTYADLITELIFTDVPPFVSKLKMDKVYGKCGRWLDSDYQTLLEVITEYSRVLIKENMDTDLPSAEIYNESGDSINEILVLKCTNLTRSLTKEESDDDVVIEQEVIMQGEHLISMKFMNIGIEEIGSVEDLIADEDTNLVMEQKEEEIANQDCVGDSDPNLSFKVQALPETESPFPMKVIAVLGCKQVVLKSVHAPTGPSQTLGENCHEDQEVLSNISNGTPCIAHCGSTDVWERAVVHDISGKEYGYVFVFFVDRGTVDSVALTDIRSIKPEWLEKPVVCYLANLHVDLKSESNKEHVCQLLKKMQGKSTQVKIITREPLVVHLLDQNGDLAYRSLITSGMLVDLG